MAFFEKIFGNYSDKEIKRIQPTAGKVLAYEEELKKLDDSALKAKTAHFKEELARGRSLDDILPEAFAVCREAAYRVLGMEHFPEQILGGIVLHQGRISEMKTGEGKTLMSTLPAYLNALAGKGVHIVTVNDYLAKRDSEWMGKIFKFLGLTVGLIVHGMDHEAKQAAYNADITYATNNELGFDYLRDNMVKDKVHMVQRGQHYAIVDEVDSILVDEARTPLIISGPSDKANDLYKSVDAFVKRLKAKIVVESEDKKNDDEVDADYIVDEKARSSTLTARGIKKAVEYFKLKDLGQEDGDDNAEAGDENDSSSEISTENMQILHHINQAIKAYGNMKRDREYVVNDNGVTIVDEFTGRLMVGRRYSDGLHQAIEAKENVKVERENKTLATITFQNYFRLYTKLAGMTGTAQTEEAEFRQIYNLDVVVIPTHETMIRTDMADSVYKTEKGKLTAVVGQVEECHQKGQPVLVGTVSIEKSEQISAMLKTRGVKHEVLNAKFHEKEAQIIAQAGKKDMVTIATNMAGRGTDIMLGGNAEYMAKTEMARLKFSEEEIAESTSFGDTDDERILEARKTFNELNAKYKEQIKPAAQEVKDLGGLFIIGTERHESRRIDNQLRGRAGRQGDPGASRFFLSLEDDLMRLFAPERMSNMMTLFKLPEDQPIEANMLTGLIEKAQKQMEDRNFNHRKHVLQYDEVMNEQRKMIYAQRQKVLDGEDLHAVIERMIDETIEHGLGMYATSEYSDDWNLNELSAFARTTLGAPANVLKFLSEDQDKDSLCTTLRKYVDERIEQQRSVFADDMPKIERFKLLDVVDDKWMDHLDEMEQLKSGIGLSAYAQRDPIVQYRLIGSDMYDEMLTDIACDTVRAILNATPHTPLRRAQRRAQPMNLSHGGDSTIKRQPLVKTAKPELNKPCPCGSGIKYKKCCRDKDA